MFAFQIVTCGKGKIKQGKGKGWNLEELNEKTCIYRDNSNKRGKVTLNSFDSIFM